MYLTAKIYIFNIYEYLFHHDYHYINGFLGQFVPSGLTLNVVTKCGQNRCQITVILHFKRDSVDALLKYIWLWTVFVN